MKNVYRLALFAMLCVNLTAQQDPYIATQQKQDASGGNVVLSMVVDEQGNPTNIKVARSSGNPELDRKAKEAAEKYRFKPGLDKSGKPVKVSVTLQVNFKTNPDLKKDPSPNSAVKAPPQ